MSAAPAAVPPLAVTGVGLVTSVGSSALATVAALRAGVARFREVPGAQILDRSGTRAEAVGAARSPLHGAGDAPGRLAATLLAAAVADAETWTQADRWVSSAGRWLQGDATVEAEGALEHIGILDQLVALAADGLHAPTGLATADSLATASALRHYAAAGRLKGSAAPSGLVPGEAAAALVVEPVASARARARPVLAVVECWGRGWEPVPLDGSAPSAAQGLTEALTGATRLSSTPGLLVADLNGERARALEWSLAMPRVLAPQGRALSTWTPADGVGDCGQATGLLLVACAALALARGWARADHALVSVSDDGGRRCAVMLRAADRVGPLGEPLDDSERTASPPPRPAARP